MRRCMHACVCTETASGSGPMIEITLMSTLCSDIGTLVADRASKLLQLPGCRLVPTGQAPAMIASVFCSSALSAISSSAVSTGDSAAGSGALTAFVVAGSSVLALFLTRVHIVQLSRTSCMMRLEQRSATMRDFTLPWCVHRLGSCGACGLSYPQPPDQSPHGCTVGIDRDPPV